MQLSQALLGHTPVKLITPGEENAGWEYVNKAQKPPDAIGNKVKTDKTQNTR